MGIYCCRDEVVEVCNLIYETIPPSIYRTRPPCWFGNKCPCSCHNNNGVCYFSNECLHITK